MKRILLLTITGGAMLIGAYFALPALADKTSVRVRSGGGIHATLASRVPAREGTAPVLRWSEATTRERKQWEAKKAARLIVAGDRTLVGDEELSQDHVREYLDSKVRDGQIDYVIVSTKNSSLSAITEVLEQCRLSRVGIVVLD